MPLIYGSDPIPVPTTITVLTEAGDFVTDVATDAEGNFAVKLKPGIYWIMPEVFTLSSSPIRVCRLQASAFQVTVEKNAVSSVQVLYGTYCFE